MKKQSGALSRHPNSIEALASSGAQKLSTAIFLNEDTGYTSADWDHPDAALKRSFDGFYRLISERLEVSRADPVSIEQVKLALGTPRAQMLPYLPLLSNMCVRKQGYELLFTQLERAWAGPPGTRRRWFFGTLITDLGNTLEYAPVLEMERIRRDFRKVMKRTGLNTIAFIEIQAGTNYPQQGHGRTLMCHAHFIGFTDEESFDLRRANTIASAGTILSNWLGAPTVRIDTIANRSELKRRCYYLFKAPLKGSYLIPNPNFASGYQTEHADVDRSLALRLAEVLSQLDYSQATFTTGAGTELKGAWLRALTAWQRLRRNMGQENFAAAFAEVWATGGTTVPRTPVQTRWTANAAPSASWNHAMSTYLQSVAAHRDRSS
jgi:hypothetical protein